MSGVVTQKEMDSANEASSSIEATTLSNGFTDNINNTKRKNKLGRAKRRRIAKSRSIQYALDDLLSQFVRNRNEREKANDDGDQNNLEEICNFFPSSSPGMRSKQVPVPRDRDMVWPGVLDARRREQERGKHEEYEEDNGNGRKNLKLSKSDELHLIRQLGYVPGNAIGVAARVNDLPLDLKENLKIDHDIPIVLKLYPLAVREKFLGGKSDGRKFKGRCRGKCTNNSGDKRKRMNLDDEKKQQEQKDATIADTTTDCDSLKGDIEKLSSNDELLVEPFPTIFWLTHPLLRVMISKLEDENCVRKLEDRLQQTCHKQSLELMKEVHEKYGNERWALLSSDDQNLIQFQKGWYPAFDPCKRGVGGLRKHYAVKCLHLHAAHYLSNGDGSCNNIIGKWVMDDICDIISCHNSTQDSKSKHNDDLIK